MREAERDKHCVCVDSRPYTVPRAQSYKMLQYMWFEVDKCTLILHGNTHPHISHNTLTHYHIIISKKSKIEEYPPTTRTDIYLLADKLTV